MVARPGQKKENKGERVSYIEVSQSQTQTREINMQERTLQKT